MEQRNVQPRTKKLRACASKKEKKSRKLKQKRENKTQKIQVMKMRSVKEGGALLKFNFAAATFPTTLLEHSHACSMNEKFRQTCEG
jgi:hypothetical protein